MTSHLTRLHIREAGAALAKPLRSQRPAISNPDTCARAHRTVYSRIRQVIFEAVVIVATVWSIGYLSVLGWNWRMGVR